MQVKASNAQWVLVISSGVFLGFVLYVYEAFGIYQGVSFSGHGLLERVLLFAFGASVTFALNEFFLRPILRLDTLLRSVLWIIWEVWSAGTVTHVFFNYFWNWTESNWHSYFLLLGEVSSVFTVPFLLYFLIDRKAPHNQINSRLLIFKSANGKEEFAIRPKHLLYIKAEDNYVSIVHESKGEERSTVLRKKLSSLMEEYPNLKQVHRSYLVNPKAVQRIEKKPKSAKVHFSTGSYVPVSETFRHTLNDF